MIRNIALIPCWIVLLMSLLVAGCAAPTWTKVTQASDLRPLHTGGGKVVLLSGIRGPADRSETTFMDCLVKEFSNRLSKTYTVMDTGDFQDALFPWFEAEHAPRTVEELNRLLARALVHERIATLGIRYLVVVASAESSEGFPGLICGAGYGGAGCFGMMWEDKTYHARAVIWDIAQGIESGTLAATSKGKSVGFAFVVPVLLIADTLDSACHALATELARLLSDAGEADPGRH